MTNTERDTKWILALLASVVFLAVVNGNMINIALPHIGRDFGVSEGTYGWIVTGYILTFGIFSAVNGRLADVFGMKRMYIAGLVAFGAGAAVVALSPTIEFAIAIRVLQGIGAAALPVLGSSIIARLVPAEERGEAMGVILSTVGVAASIGPFLGGFIVEVAGWRFVFAFTALVLLAVPFAVKLLPAELDEPQADGFDIVGAVLLSAAAALGVYGFELVEESGFGTPLYLCLGASATLAGLFWAWIHKAKRPFASPEILRDFRYIATVSVAFLSNSTRFGTIVLVPIFLTTVNAISPISIGFVLFPGALAIAVLSTRAGRLADRVGPRLPVGLGALFIVAGNLVTAFYAGTSTVGVAVGMGLYGIGFAGIQSPCVAAVSQIVPREQAGVGIGIFMMIFFLGAATGTALAVTAVELQQPGAASWLGLSLGAGGPYSNAILVLTGLAVLGLFFVPFLPDKAKAEGGPAAAE